MAWLDSLIYIGYHEEQFTLEREFCHHLLTVMIADMTFLFPWKMFGILWSGKWWLQTS